jgi:hypothetical protein
METRQIKMKTICRGIRCCEETKSIEIDNIKTWQLIGIINDVPGYEIHPNFRGTKETIYKLLKKAILFAKGKNLFISGEHPLLTQEQTDELYKIYKPEGWDIFLNLLDEDWDNLLSIPFRSWEEAYST